MDDFQARCRALTSKLRDAGWSVVAERAIPYGRMFSLSTGGGAEANLNCYHGKKGFKFVPGGKRADEVARILGGEAPKREARRPGSDDPFELGWPRIGGDESGKGDYFGPLTVAAFHMERDDADTLRSLGVGDSKGLTDRRIERIANELETMERGAVRVLMPRDYNARYAERGNLNILLAEMHGECVRALRAEGAADVAVVVIDQFAKDTTMLRSELALPTRHRLVTRTKGEADPAVAAASILARAAFVEGLRELGHEFGQMFPPGAGKPVLQAGAAFVRTFGRDRLADVAKVHFATTRQL